MNQIPNIEERCEHGVVAKYCFRCKRPDLAGPIPNIEETHNTREVEEWREQFRSCFSDLPDEYECCNGKDCNCNGATVLESIETFIHHQLQKALEVQAIQIREEEANEYNKIIERELQKARQDWLREMEEVCQRLKRYADRDNEKARGVQWAADIMLDHIKSHSELDQDTCYYCRSKANLKGMIEAETKVCVNCKRTLPTELDQPTLEDKE